MPRRKSTPRKGSIPSKRFKRTIPSDEIHLQVGTVEPDNHYKLGSIIISINEVCDADPESFTLQFMPESCNILWHDDQMNKENSIPVGCNAPYEIAKFLSEEVKHFDFISHRLCTGDNFIDIYLKSSAFVIVKDPSVAFKNPNRKNLYALLQFFRGMEFDDYDVNYLYEETHVNKLYDNIPNGYNPRILDISIYHDDLLSKLRKYQCQALFWMLKRERPTDIQNEDLHVLYTVINNEKGKELYFHKYGGFFVNQKFTSEKSCRGGILADEMGLGKTLEVLACILLNSRKDLTPENEKVCAKHNISLTGNKDEISKEKEKIGHFEDDTDDYSDFLCVCGPPKNKASYESAVACQYCNVKQHIDCVLNNPTLHKDFTCPHCWINMSNLVSSRATLIISPASIIYQWLEEIERHIKKNCLKVFMYNGVEYQKFIDPSILADNDIVLISYETLRKELNHIDIPPGNKHSLRHRKKYMFIPSPVCAVEWWRICLDEAQMVENITTKVAKVVGKLHGINRWCVSGTPFRKSVEDLYGLLVFLKHKPYEEKMWWKEVMWLPFINGNSSPVSSVLKDIAWRTTKKEVFDQMGIPPLRIVNHRLNFTQVEKVFYDNWHQNCKEQFLEKINSFESLDISLHLMDKSLLKKLLLPLKKLQMCCCHYNINRSNDVRTVSTPAELVAYLLKKSKYETEDALRKLLMAFNGLAGIYILQEKFDSAVETYEKALNLIEKYKSIVRADLTQRIHISFHLANILSSCEENGNKISSKFVASELKLAVQTLTNDFMQKSHEKIETGKNSMQEIDLDIASIKHKFNFRHTNVPTSTWWLGIVENLREKSAEFVNKLQDTLNNAPGKSFMKTTPGNRIFFSSDNIISNMHKMLWDFHDTRKALRSIMKLLSKEITPAMCMQAISCHLRPEIKTGEKKCIFCEADELFKEYEYRLYRFEKEKEQTINKEESSVLPSIRRGCHTDSDVELVLKYFYNFARRTEGDPKCIEDAVIELNLFDTFKKEFKILRNLWLKCVEYVSTKDEIEMAKISTRILSPDEVPPNPPVSYLLHYHEVQSKRVQYYSDAITYEQQFKKKLGRLFYLQNLEKAENKNIPFEETCPVCQLAFGSQWSVLQCGHNFCIECMQKLMQGRASGNAVGRIHVAVPCPVCREETGLKEVYFVDATEKKTNVEVIGNYSTKILEIVQCLLEISKDDKTAKSLVFSSFTEFLTNLESALKINKIKCLNFCHKTHFQDDLKRFKESEDTNILLIPLSFGCSGLNLTEATNVLLVEPVLETSMHFQAIGRIHRIGQTKVTTVHRFYMSRTIEEQLHFDQLDNQPPAQGIHQNTTLEDVKRIFEDVII